MEEENKAIEILIILNEWLDRQIWKHWEIQARLRFFRIEPTPAFQQWKQMITSHPRHMMPLLKLTLGEQFVEQWQSANVNPNHFTSIPRTGGTYIIGARWSSGRVQITGQQGTLRHHDLKPFQLEFPWHLHLDYYYAQVKGPEDLEFLWYFQTPQEKDEYTHRGRDYHVEKFKPVLFDIRRRNK